MISREDLARACRRYGAWLWLPPAIDGAKLLWALAGCESSFGQNCRPRHEPLYHRLAEEKKNLRLVQLTEQWGCDAHCSFGPWQELLVNCSPSMRPEDFANIGRAGLEVATFINRRILEVQRPQTVEEIAEAYNSGKWQWAQLPPGVARYAQQALEYYNAADGEMPAGDY